MASRYNPPPNWPQPPAGWTPEPGWQPNPEWGPPPPGHQLWVEDPPQKKSGKGKKILVGVVAAVVLIIVLANLGGGGDGDVATPVAESQASAPAETSEAPTEAPAEEPAPPAEPAEAGIGVPVRDGKLEFTVTGVERPGNTIGPEFMAETAQGEFVIVRVDVTNIGDEAQMLDSSSQKLFNEAGQEFSPSSAIFVLEDAQKAFLETINPGNSITGAPLLFDVAPGAVLDSIELHDSPFSGGVTVSLAGS